MAKNCQSIVISFYRNIGSIKPLMWQGPVSNSKINKLERIGDVIQIFENEIKKKSF